MLVSSFAGIIILGTLLLNLSIAHRPGKVSLLDALFTATSAVCVTGLATVDTGKDFTLFGQLVILTLIQLGGLGIMTFGALAFEMLGQRMSLRAQAALQDSFFQRSAAGEIRKIFLRMVLLTVIIEFIGALMLFVFMIPKLGVGKAFYSAIFHAISAFCNAGFSIYSNSLVPFQHDYGIITVIALLIVLGGLGHAVLLELGRLGLSYLAPQRPVGPVKLSLNARIIAVYSLWLIVIGTACLLLFDFMPKEKSWFAKFINAFFQSVTTRTAGFNTVDIGVLSLPNLMIIVFLMFIGGSPASCAGGVKTTTLAVWIAFTRAGLKNEEEIVLFGRRIDFQTVHRALLLFAFALGWHMLGVLILSLSESELRGVQLMDLLFEQASASGTVGLSTGITSKLSHLGKLWIILSMFVGRLGPLTIGMWVVESRRKDIRYPEGKVMIG
jgi:trk system potassium uptake protein TrkH